ncbi:MAG: DUF882 domain-containing protein [Thermodesulfobacteriota bacterium]
MKYEYHASRRTFVKTSLQLCAGLAVLSSPLHSLASLPGCKPMIFLHTHTGERLKLDYSTDFCSLKHRDVDTFLRDFRTGDIHPIDPKLFDTIHKIRKLSGSRGDIEIISGYRSPATNARLRNRSNGVAKKSLHMQGQALDIRISDLSTRKLRDIAASLCHGGVGYYPKSDFVHIDTGKVRCW